MINKKGEVFLRVRNSRKLYLPFYIMVVVLLIVVGYIQYTGNSLNDMALALVLTFTAAVAIVTEIHRFGNLYEISERYIVHTNGYFSTVSKRVEFGAISDIDVKQNVWQRMLNFGHIQLYKFAEGPILKNLNKPFDFTDVLQDKMRIAKRGE